MAHNIMIFLYEIFDVKITYSFANYNFVIWNIHLKGLFPHPSISEFHLLSYLTLLYFPLQIQGIIGVEILERRQLRINLWN